MSWITELDKYGHNFLIDELVWHLELGKTPTAVIFVNDSECSGYEFTFSEFEPMFLKVSFEAFHDNWIQAKEIVRKFYQLEGMCFRNGPLF